MMTEIFYFLCRCMARRKKREERLATITPKCPDPRLVGIRANQPIQFIVPTTSVYMNEMTDDTMSETDYSSGGPKILPSLLENRRKRTLSGFQINPADLEQGLYVGMHEALEKRTLLRDLGRVGFSLNYNVGSSCLTVRLIGAQNLPCLFLKTTANPCAKVTILPEKLVKYMSKVQKNTMNPVFNECFVFTIRQTELGEKHLKITILDYDRFSRRCFVGQVTSSLKDLGLTSDLESDVTTGDIWINLKPDHLSYKKGNGEILFSLCYDPDKSSLTLTVLKVRGLNMGKEGTKDGMAYVKVTLYVRRKMVRTKKTSSKKKAPEIEFNNSFSVHVSPSSLKDIDFLVTLTEKPQGLASKRNLGKTQVGGNSINEQEQQHWQDMLTSPKSTCVQWHMLYG